MKQLFKLMTFAAVAIMAFSCGNKEEKVQPAGKPVVTPDMFSVTADSESGTVVFRFTAEGLSPFWTVTEPSGNKLTFTDREITKTFTAKGTYKGTLVAFGTGGQSDPFPFSFSVGKAVPVDPDLNPVENILVSETWKLHRYGYFGDDWADEDNAALGNLPIPSCAADDRMKFEKGGAFKLDQGADKTVYNDGVTGGIQEGVTVTGNEKWSYVKEGDADWIQFSNGGFPGMIGDEGGINGKYQIRDLSSESFRLFYNQDGQWFFVTLVPDWYEEPVESDVTEEAAKAALSGKTFQISDYGWWGDGWQYFAVADGGEEVPVNMANDSITFGADGSLSIVLGIDPPLEEGGEEAARIYNDGIANGEVYTVTGSPKWKIVTAGGAVKVQFTDGGFPLVLAGQAGVAPEDPNYHYGLNASWTVASIQNGTVRIEIYQSWSEQWLSVFLTPVK